MRLHNDEVQCHVRPCKVGELELIVAGLERGNEEDESFFLLAMNPNIGEIVCVLKPTENVEEKADEAVVRRQRKQDLVNQHNVLKIVDDRLAIEEVHCGRQPVPVEALGRA